MSNNLRYDQILRIYATYAPCKVQTTIDAVPFDVKGVDYMRDAVLLCGDYSGGMQTHNVYQHEWWKISKHAEFPILLYPLSEITDEDANQCAVMCGLHLAGNKITRAGFGILIENDTYQLRISHNGYICLRKNEALYNMDMRRIIDFLRSKGYDCGYGEIPSLIEAGIAIDKTTLKK